MTDTNNLGILNGHAVGIIMKELVRRAMVAIRNEKQAFEVHPKVGYGGQLDDMLTSADAAAQKVYIRSLKECFPQWGIVAEEDSLIVPCTDGTDTFFTVDPLDGTKAFVRGQSHGVGTMISLSRGTEFLSAYVGDVNTLEIYGFRPGSRRVHRISEFNVSKELSIEPKPLRIQYLLLRDPENDYCPLSRRLIHAGFKSVCTDGGSIGTWCARLWKGEVGALLLHPNKGNAATPWDENPVNAISRKLGFVSLRPSDDGTRWVQFESKPLNVISTCAHDTLVVHECNVGEIICGEDQKWLLSKAAIESAHFGG
mgnify:CR=1 FL=1